MDEMRTFIDQTREKLNYYDPVTEEGEIKEENSLKYSELAEENNFLQSTIQILHDKITYLFNKYDPVNVPQKDHRISERKELLAREDELKVRMYEISNA